jgi:glutaredoxin
VKALGRAAFAVALAMAAASVVPLETGCKRSQASVVGDTTAPPTVKDDSDGLLLTWVDDRGDFHVESKVGDVPLMGRDTVRVVDPARDDPSLRERVFVADLRQLRPDGTYAVHPMARSDFEAIAVARREKAGPTLANPGPAPVAADSAEGAGAQTGAAHSRPVVVIYGAEWCGACHQAMRYLQRKGIAYVEKDVEKDPAAAREMQMKLARAGLRGGSIPVIDVGGKVMVGFSASEIEGALGQAL